MNLNYMLAGSASTNQVMYTAAILLLVAGPAACLYSVDHLLLLLFKHFRGQMAITGRVAPVSKR